MRLLVSLMHLLQKTCFCEQLAIQKPSSSYTSTDGTETPFVCIYSNMYNECLIFTCNVGNYEKCIFCCMQENRAFQRATFRIKICILVY